MLCVGVPRTAAGLHARRGRGQAGGRVERGARHLLEVIRAI